MTFLSSSITIRIVCGGGGGGQQQHDKKGVKWCKSKVSLQKHYHIDVHLTKLLYKNQFELNNSAFRTTVHFLYYLLSQRMCTDCNNTIDCQQYKMSFYFEITFQNMFDIYHFYLNDFLLSRPQTIHVFRNVVLIFLH